LSQPGIKENLSTVASLPLTAVSRTATTTYPLHRMMHSVCRRQADALIAHTNSVCWSLGSVIPKDADDAADDK